MHETNIFGSLLNLETLSQIVKHLGTAYSGFFFSLARGQANTEDFSCWEIVWCR